MQEQRLAQLYQLTRGLSDVPAARCAALVRKGDVTAWARDAQDKAGAVGALLSVDVSYEEAAAGRELLRVEHV